MKQLLFDPTMLARYKSDSDAKDIASGWFENPAAKKVVSEILKRFDLDESAIEAEAIRLMSEQLERLDRSLTLARAPREGAPARDGLPR